ncbi:MAG: tetratricopeptide repeat protein, partial [Terriglobales bacterium]
MSRPLFARNQGHYSRPMRAMLLGAITAMLSTFVPAGAQNAFLQQGIKEYNAGDYNNAAGHLGAALSTEFNNAILHYYLANTYVKLKQRDGAIREFRIAYALAPDQEVGKLSRTALTSMGAQAPDPSEKDSMLAREIQRVMGSLKPAGTPSGETNYDQGRILFGRGDYTNAATAFLKAGRADPRNYAARYYEALSMEKSGSLAQAMQLYQAVKTSCGTGRESHMAALKLIPNADPAELKTLEQTFLMQTGLSVPAAAGVIDVPFTRDGRYILLEGSVGSRMTKIYYDPY